MSLARDADRDRDADAACRSRAAARRCARPAISASSARCSGATSALVSCLSLTSIEELRVVRLLQLGRDREPEARTAAADEGRERLQELSRVRIPVCSAAARAPPPPRGSRVRRRSATSPWSRDIGASSGSQTSTYDRYGEVLREELRASAATRARRQPRRRRARRRGPPSGGRSHRPTSGSRRPRSRASGAPRSVCSALRPQQVVARAAG